MRQRLTSHSSSIMCPAAPTRAPADPGVDREIQGQIRHGLERSARADLR